MSASETSSIEDRLAALEAERGVGAALARYGHSIDYGLAEQWADCFTADGVFDIWVRALDGTWAPWARHEGRAQLTAFAATHAHAPEHALKHLMVEPAITIDGARASAHSYFVRI
ncbi:MAG TPA: nuclear transport factor 2 family protein, partial [Ilumatobacteraceae bacterium]